MFKFLIVIFPYFNAAATTAFVDPFRAANYLSGKTCFHWEFASLEGGLVRASNGMDLSTQSLGGLRDESWDLVVVSCSWTPEKFSTPQFLSLLRNWANKGCMLGALDTGTFLLAEAGLLNGKRATGHYEHIDALIELYPEVDIVEDLYVFDQNRITCCGGAAGTDVALQLIRNMHGETLANEAARYVFHPEFRPGSTRQNPEDHQPMGHTIPIAMTQAIKLMETHLEDVISIPDISERVGISQRQLDRLFRQIAHKTPALYYRDIRLDRARGLVTQTSMPLTKVGVASGFPNQSHFCRAYRERFGITPSQDRHEGRVPFDYRAWPMHQSGKQR
ncbi:GlxA family transcriptional regulator [Stutzerimonas xanthomarina]|uniref:GlxA family transcriptional regulator n=1 Tax=Stutzerimonas xanthomarina TaxID=271420 RepID=UPI001C8C27AC|nr:GlxA family transcriptional regulator [Stutzerimonas xanthomarina]